MAVSLNPRAERLLARLPQVTVYSLLELLLLVLIAVQCARLFWAALTPLGPLGEWKALDLMRPAPPPAATLVGFDPFFRQVPGAAQAPVVVTALDVRLYGVMGNQATGGGSAIIGPPNGTQRIVAIGEEIIPGVVLTGIAFDHVTINRGGAAERLYLDQSPAPAAGAAPGVPPGMGRGQEAPPPPEVRPPPVMPSPTPPPILTPQRQAPSRPTPSAQTLKVDQ